MALEKKDVRLKISPEAHAQLAAAAEFHEKDISEFGSFLLERALLGEGHAIKLYVQRVSRWGSSGKASGADGETQGHAGGRSGKRDLKSV